MTPTHQPTKSLRNSRRHKTLEKIRDQNAICKAAPGEFIPVVDPQKCEGKGDCAVVCPYDVFEIKKMPDAQFSTLPLTIKLKLWMHGRQTAFTPNMDACRACGACVKACPEHAITLQRAPKP